jgi:alpha-maltose-1-phosphate synthase
MTAENEGGFLNICLFAYWHDPNWKNFIGPSVKIWDLARNLHDQGHRVVLYLPKYGFRDIGSAFSIVEIPVVDLPWFRALSFNLFLIFELVFHRRIFRPDIVYLRRTRSLVPMGFARLTKALFFFEVNDDPYWAQGCKLDKKTSVIDKLSVWVDEINLHFSHRIFVISKAVIQKIRQRNSYFLNSKLELMPSGANTDLFRPMNRCQAVKFVKLNPAHKYVGFVGTLLEHQGVDTLIGAAPSIVKNKPNCRFIIIGEGPMKRKWQEMVQKVCLENLFIFTGQIDYTDLPRWINAMEICLAPYRKTAGYRSPVKIFDYLSCARPVIASRIEGTTDVFAGLASVFLIPPEDEDALSETIAWLLDHPEKMAAKGRQGRQWVQLNHDRADLARRVARFAIDGIEKRRHPCTKSCM